MPEPRDKLDTSVNGPAGPDSAFDGAAWDQVFRLSAVADGNSADATATVTWRDTEARNLAAVASEQHVAHRNAGDQALGRAAEHDGDLVGVRQAEAGDVAGFFELQCELESGALIGRIGMLCHHDWPLADLPVPEVGWVLHRDFWGRGLATEGGRASVDCWREHLPGEPRLYSFTTHENRRSLGAVECEL